MSRLMLLLAGLVFTATGVSGADYEIDCKLWKGDPNGSRKDGTQKLVSSPKIVVGSAQKSSLLVGGQFVLGGQFVPVGREVHVVSTKEGEGCVKVNVVLELHTVVGEGANRQVETKREQTTSIIKLGETVRVKLVGEDPKKSDWVEVTVRGTK